MTYDILGIGVVAVDELVYVDHYPAADTKMPVPAMRRQGGGLTATALVAAARLGARVAYFNRLGDDELSRYSIAELEREGVDCSRLLFDPLARPYHSVIIVDRSTGSRTIMYTGEGVRPPQPEEITAELIALGRVLFLDHHTGPAGVRAMDLAQSVGIPVVVDVEGENLPGVPELLARADHLIIGEALAARVTGEAEPERMVAALVAGAPSRACVAVTAGARGCWYAYRAATACICHQPAYEVAVLDTTGCGDVFHGAYTAALAGGRDVPACIRIASAAAGLKTMQPGGRAGIPDRVTLERFLSEHKNDAIIASP